MEEIKISSFQNPFFTKWLFKTEELIVQII